MEIGLAVSGNGASAQWAHLLADELSRVLPIRMVSVCSSAAAPLLLWARGLPLAEISHAAKRNFMGFACLADLLRQPTIAPRCAVACNCVELDSGRIVVYADGLFSQAEHLLVCPLHGQEKRVLRASAAPFRGLRPVRNGKQRLCDFSVRYGCPLFPLRMAGIQRTMSLQFSGGSTPAQVAADSLRTLTGRRADLHYEIGEFSGKGNPADWARDFVQTHEQELYDRLLFYTSLL